MDTNSLDFWHVLMVLMLTLIFLILDWNGYWTCSCWSPLLSSIAFWSPGKVYMMCWAISWDGESAHFNSSNKSLSFFLFLLILRRLSILIIWKSYDFYNNYMIEILENKFTYWFFSKIMTGVNAFSFLLHRVDFTIDFILV